MGMLSGLLLLFGFGYLSWWLLLQALMWCFEPVFKYLEDEETKLIIEVDESNFMPSPDKRVEVRLEDDESLTLINKYVFNKVKRRRVNRRF